MTDPLISNDQAGQRSGGGYQSIEGGNATPSISTGTQVDSLRAFFSQARDAKQSSQGCCDFCLTFFGLLIGSLVWTIVLIITLTLPLVMIILGVTYFHQCPGQFMIPIYNIVAGCVLTVSNVTNMIVRFNRMSDRDLPKTLSVIGWITTILNIFLLGWFVAGCYWVFSLSAPSNEECHTTLYSFTFWLLNAVFIFFGAMVVASVVMACLIFMCW